MVHAMFVVTCNNNWLLVTNDYDCILAMLLGSNKNGRLEVTQFSVPTTSGTVSVSEGMQGATHPG